MLSRIVLLGLLLAASLPAQPAAQADAPSGAVWVLDLDGAVGPATSDYLQRGIAGAQQSQARLIVIRMNTPGGLDSSMRDIIAAILASAVPVATYVAPQGARAASAGTYILYASHIAAMAPATHLGAATPVTIGVPEPAQPEPDAGKANAAKGTAMERKMINDAAAYIRGLAILRKRNAEWAESAVRDASSLSASEALDAQVIDYIATDLPALLQTLDGVAIAMGDSSVVLALQGAPIHNAQPDWRTEFLATITDPNLVLILGMIGFYGIILEFYNPGSLLPGTIGVICLLLAGYSLQLLPVNYAGLALLLVGIALMVAEALSPSFGVLGIGGLTAFTIGGIILFDTDIEAFQVGWPLLLGMGVLTAGFIMITASMALRMRHQAVTTGIDSMLGRHGVALGDFEHEGQVNVAGEIWHAQCEQALCAGDRVIVKQVSGLMLTVAREELG